MRVSSWTKSDNLRSEGTSVSMGLQKRGTHLVDIDPAQGKQVFDNRVSPVPGSVQQKGLDKGQKLNQITHPNERAFLFPCEMQLCHFLMTSVW